MGSGGSEAGRFVVFNVKMASEGWVSDGRGASEVADFCCKSVEDASLLERSTGDLTPITGASMAESVGALPLSKLSRLSSLVRGICSLPLNPISRSSSMSGVEEL